jgi:hypothetical protein
LRPHAYSRYSVWSERFGPEGAMELIRHEMAHLQAFEELAKLKGAYDAMRSDQGDDDDIFKLCKLIEDPSEAEEFSQMKGALAAIVHPTGQV